MTRKEIIDKYKRCLKEIHQIELTSDKSKRLRWRELQKVKKWMKYHYNIKDEEIKI